MENIKPKEPNVIDKKCCGTCRYVASIASLGILHEDAELEAYCRWGIAGHPMPEVYIGTDTCVSLENDGRSCSVYELDPNYLSLIVGLQKENAKLKKDSQYALDSINYGPEPTQDPLH